MCMAVCVFFLWWPSVLNLAVIHPNELPLCDTHRISVAIEVETLHWATFLQLNIIDFPLLFPHPSILSGPRRNDSECMSGDILPIVRCHSPQKVLDRPFCNFHGGPRWIWVHRICWPSFGIIYESGSHGITGASSACSLAVVNNGGLHRLFHLGSTNY